MKEYHILSLSGGKDSTALAFFIKDNMPEIFEELELVFFDTECELPETYDYLNKIEIFLNKPVLRVKPFKSFDDFYTTYKLLPSIRRRWCTIEMKTKTFRKFTHDRIQGGIKSSSLLTSTPEPLPKSRTSPIVLPLTFGQGYE